MQGKTLWLGALTSTFSILFPGIKIAVCSRTLDQAKETFGKIREFYGESKALQNEIAEFGTGKQNRTITFKNGSKITIYPVSDNARGGRSHITIVDEFFFTDFQKYVEVIVPFQSGKRTPKFTHKKQWEDMRMVESNKTIYTSSSVMESHWGYEEYSKFCNKMKNNEDYLAVALPVQINILNGFKTVKDLREMKLNYTTYKWETEMMATFPGISEDAFYDYTKLKSSQKAKAIYPKYYYEMLGAKSKLKYIPKEKEEIRLVSADIALVGGRKNDRSVYTVIRLIPTIKGYKRQICYIESHEGLLAKKQAMRINRLFYEFDCDYIILDTNGNGMGTFDSMVDYLTDDITGEEYPPLSCINDEKMAERCVHKNARKVIYSIKARPEFNDECYCSLKTSIDNNKIELLCSKEEGETFLSNIKGYNDLESDKQMAFQSPYSEVYDLIDELINLEVDKDVLQKQQKVKLREKAGSRKDHVSSLAYGDFIASELEREYLKKMNNKKNYNEVDFFKKVNKPYSNQNRVGGFGLW